LGAVFGQKSCFFPEKRLKTVILEISCIPFDESGVFFVSIFKLRV
jgi:hypothetical protein